MSIPHIVYGAVDPGGRTGYAMVGLPLQHDGVISHGDVIDAILDAQLNDRYMVGQCRGTRQNQAEIIASCYRRVASSTARQFRGTSRRSVLFLESYQLRGGNFKQDGIKAIQLNERLVVMGEMDPTLWDETVEQSPATKATLPSERLVRFGLYKASLPHGMDALRHLIIALRSFR